ncbi:MAG: helix-turn-helix domain-containing protein [Acidobacteriota bacterium]|nr:helix-turn-helix domain-containing protein [Acidobacteriota bacterium]
MFLRGRLSSPDQIEIVLMLLKDPLRSWTASEVSEALGMAPESTAMRLFLLASQGLIVFEPQSVPRYRYGVADETTDRLLRELASSYATNRDDVLRAIEARVESDPIQSFADAFKLKK